MAYNVWKTDDHDADAQRTRHRNAVGRAWRHRRERRSHRNESDVPDRVDADRGLRRRHGRDLSAILQRRARRSRSRRCTPLPALEFEGRDIYIREGCHVCHTQMVRPLRAETERYGHYSVAGEDVYEHPFLWGSKRTGPDLARVGGRYSDDWHRAHLNNPRSVVPQSNMPALSVVVRHETHRRTDRAQTHRDAHARRAVHRRRHRRRRTTPSSATPRARR